MNQAQTYQGAEAADRLAQLGLSPDVLVRVIQRAAAEAATCTELDPVSFQGLLMWGKMVRFLREELIYDGWLPRHPKNQELTIHVERGLKLLVVGGDSGTGAMDRYPQPKNPKGPTFFEAVVGNEIPFDFGPEFDGPEGFIEPDVLEALQTWMVVFHAAKNGQLFLEVSLPNPTLLDGYVTWSERIIIEIPDPDAPIGRMIESGDDPDPYQVTVERMG